MLADVWTRSATSWGTVCNTSLVFVRAGMRCTTNRTSKVILTVLLTTYSTETAVTFDVIFAFAKICLTQ